MPFIIKRVQQFTEFLSALVIYRVINFNIMTHHTLIAQYI
jgi:hypothetical protein